MLRKIAEYAKRYSGQSRGEIFGSLFFMKGIRIMLQKIIAFVINFLTLSSPCGLMTDILKDTRKYKFYDPLRELEIAENHFNFCEQEYMSAAIFELRSAESRVERLTGGVIL